MWWHGGAGGDVTVTPACSPYDEDDKERVVVVGWAEIGPGKEERRRRGRWATSAAQPFKNMWIFPNSGIGKREKKGKEVKKGEGVLQTKNRIC